MSFKKSILTGLCVAASFTVHSDTVKIGAIVLDDVTSQPIQNAEVCFSFKEDIGWRAWTESAKPQRIFCRTDNNGFCEAKGTSNCGEGGCYVKHPPEDYYRPGIGWGHTYREKNLFGVWQPDNLVATIKLQRVEHPIPLFVKRVDISRELRQTPGFGWTNDVWKYDLVIGDWLPPVGKGKVTDMTIESEYKFFGRVKGVSDFDCYEHTYFVAFPGVGNGIMEKTIDSTFGIKLRQAATNGFERSVKRCYGQKKLLYGVNITSDRYSDEDPNRCYAFRIRSRYDEKGKLIEAYYGKIYGDFHFRSVVKYNAAPFFLYYLNPTSLDRNLEWDMKTNLCPNPGDINQRQP